MTINIHRAAALILAIVFTPLIAAAQCESHPRGLTALRLDNQSSYALTFFVDYDRSLAVASRTISSEVVVEPGEHLLRARAVVDKQELWVAAMNEVPKGMLCTWTIIDPDSDDRAVGPYRDALRFIGR